MYFQSQIFLLAFLPLTLAIWYGWGAHRALREWCLLALSLVFYAWWDPRFVPLLLAQGILSWIAAEVYLRARKRPKWLLGFAIAGNLCILGFFKYWVFLAANLYALFGVQLPEFSIILPIGISFFTFEIVSYLVDVGWRGAPHYSLRHFGLFVAFFPRLIAGPIVRHNEIIPQLDADPWRAGASERFGQGATLLVIGLTKKVFLADQLAPIADRAFALSETAVPSLAVAWSGALAFTFQLFLDFSAYSEMAIGIALMMGLRLPPNFEAPYQALDLRDFWRRWHMTLSRYLRDYVYIPLGGNRHGPLAFAVATMLTMTLCGLWHGAGWTYIAWGAIHGIGLLVCRAWQSSGQRLPAAAAWTLTFLFVVVGWVLFRSSSFGAAGNMLAGMIGGGERSLILDKPHLLAVGAAVSIFGPTSWQIATTHLVPQRALGILVGLLAAAIVLETGKGQSVTFIYFQF